MTRPRASSELEASIREFIAAEDAAETLAEQAAEMRARAKYLGETVLVSLVNPEDMTTGVQLSDGSAFVFEHKMKCHVAEAMKTSAYEYLEANKAGGLLRRYLTLSFGKDSAEQVRQIRTMLARVLPEYEIGVKVGKAPESLRAAVQAILDAAHVQVEVTESLELPGATLAAFVRKELKAGREVPDAFGVYAPLRPIPVAPDIPAILEADRAAINAFDTAHVTAAYPPIWNRGTFTVAGSASEYDLGRVIEDKNLGKVLLVTKEGHPNYGWVCYRSNDNWVTMREATQADLAVFSMIRL